MAYAADATQSSLRNARFNTPLVSITREMAREGYGPPADLIGSMVGDTEQSGSHHHPRHRNQPVAPAAPPPPPLHPSSDSPSLLPRRDATTLKRAHWKQADKASKCSNRECRVKFSRKIKARNCSMCGEVYCHGCTMFRRKLSQNAEPDPLGVYFHVCKACCDAQSEEPRLRDHSSTFKAMRMNKLVSLNRNYEREKEMGKGKPLSKRTDAGKRIAVWEWAEQLAKGFQANSGMVRGLLGEVKIPKWQKCDHWVTAGSVSACFRCSAPFGKLMPRKVHCRICGQVFCATCTADEILVYVDKPSGEPKWAINGKDGGPVVKPDRFELLKICNHCSSELQEILLEGVPTNPATRIPIPSKVQPEVEVSFLQILSDLQNQLMELQTNIELWLPQYLKLVDALDISDSSPHSVEGKHPMRELMRIQTNLSDSMSRLAIRSQQLKKLHPGSEMEERLLRHVMIGTFQFYTENMYLFRVSKSHLAELIPLDHLEDLQALINMQTMENIHVSVHQLMFEVLNLHKKYQFDSSFAKCIMDLLDVLETEFMAFMKRQNQNWEEHCARVKEITESKMKAKKIMISVSSGIAKENVSGVRYIVISSCSTRLLKCSRELSAKTTVMEFVRTKKTLTLACEDLERQLTLHNATPQMS